MYDDKKMIEALGGPEKLAEILGYPKHGGVQRVRNWITRGIPARVMLNHRELFASAQEELKTEAA